MRRRSDSRGGAATRLGGDDDGSGDAAPGSSPGFVDWPYFGRVPERVHYLPDNPVDKVFLDPPLKQAWSINTHALIEFPPAILAGSPT